MAAFDDIRLPVDIEIGAKGGPQFATTILDLSGGGEARNQDWSRCRAQYEVSYGIDSILQYTQLIAFFYARRGRYRAFRFKDWTDYSVTLGVIGTGNGVTTTFQVIRYYDDGSGQAFTRKITRLVAGTLKVYDNGVLKATPADYSVSASGLITFVVAPINTHAITASFEFDVPVRFDSDTMERIAEQPTAVSFSTIKLREVIE